MMRVDSGRATLGNARAVDIAAVPSLSFDDFQRIVADSVTAGQRVSSLFGAATDSPEAKTLCAVLYDAETAVMKDTEAAADLLWNTPSVMARFEATGPLPREVMGARLRELVQGPGPRERFLDREDAFERAVDRGRGEAAGAGGLGEPGDELRRPVRVEDGDEPRHDPAGRPRPPRAPGPRSRFQVEILIYFLTRTRLQTSTRWTRTRSSCRPTSRPACRARPW